MHKVSKILLSVLVCILFTVPAHADSTENGFVVLPGDVLQITVWKEEGMDREVLVLPDGTITFPLIGTLPVKYLSLSQVQSLIKGRLQSSIPEAFVTVSVNALLGHKVSVLGQVKTPGEIILNSRTGVLQAISQAGGLTPYAEEDRIIIIRVGAEGVKETISFPYSSIARGRDLEKDIDLLPGDVVLVPTSRLF